MIDEFSGEYRWLSNFWIASFVIDNKHYRSVEHYFQSMKTDNETIQELIRCQRTPMDAKKIAKTIMMRDGWNSMRLKVMRMGVKAKFDQNHHLKEKLMATYPRELVEGNWWNDVFWGVNSETGEGENNLGKILMEIREGYMNE